MEKIRVWVADSSTASRNFIKKALENCGTFEVVGSTQSGFEVIEYLEKSTLDIIVMDVLLDSSSFKITQEIMAYNPLPILLLSNRRGLKEFSENVFKGLAMGALEVIAKPDINSTDMEIREFVEKVKLLSGVKVITHLAGRKGKRKPVSFAEKEVKVKPSVVAIASSVGGPQALHYIFTQLPEDFPAGLVVVQHIFSGFAESLAEWLNGAGQVKVRLAQSLDKITPSTALIAPNNYHMLVNKDKKITLDLRSSGKEICPSADKLFESVASAYGKDAIGVVLTGMGEDGALGLKAIRDAGGKTIAQSKESCVVFGMPKASIGFGGVEVTLPLQEIPEKIIDWVGGYD